MVSFEIIVKAMLPSLSELKVLPSFCFAFKIPDDVAITNLHRGLFNMGAMGALANAILKIGLLAPAILGKTLNVNTCPKERNQCYGRQASALHEFFLARLKS